MPSIRSSRLFFLSVAAVSLVSACSGDAPRTDSSTGALHLNLELSGEAEIDEVRWAIHGAEMEPMEGVVDTSAPGATASVEVFGLPPGEAYLVELFAATADGEVVCGGNAGFDVQAGESTEVMVMLNCKPPERFGGVRVNGELNVCPELTKVVVSPLETSIGGEITLSATAYDPEDDPIYYYWSGSGGNIADRMASSTTYTCERFGTNRISVFINDEDFRCFGSWRVEVNCVPKDPSDLMCLPAQSTCQSSAIDPLLPCCDAAVPSLDNACTGDESIVNPTTCTPTGTTFTHRLSAMELAPSCNLGFDLDGCEGQSCANGGLTPGEGIDGVDNALTGLGPVLAGVGVNLSVFNEAFSDSLCGQIPSPQGRRCATSIEPTDIVFVVDPNFEEGCANVETISNGSSVGNVILNLGTPTATGTYCASGKLGTIPFDILGMSAALGNTVVRTTMSEEGFANGLMGATIDADTAVALGGQLIPGLGAVMGQVMDIDQGLAGDVTQGCNALSTTFSIAGGPPGEVMPDDPVVPYDRTDVTTLAPFPDDFYLGEDPTTPSGYRYTVPIPLREPDVQVLYLALSAETWVLDGFSPVGGITIALGAQPDSTSLPLTAHESVDSLASMALIDVTPGSEHLGERIPFKLSPVSRRLPGQSMDHSLVLYPSIPLTPQARYAVVLTRSASTIDGSPFEPSPFLTSVLEPPQAGEAPQVAQARALLEDGVLDALASQSPPITKEDIALVFRFSVRSMDDIHRRSLSMKEQIVDRPLPSFTISSVDPGPGHVAAVVRGTWQAPNWREEGYFISEDQDGDPRITGSLDVPFVLAIPKAAEDGPVPLVMFQHGSPGYAEHVVWEADLAGLAEEGFAVIGMTDTLNREVGLSLDDQNNLLFTTLIQKWRFPHFHAQTQGDMMAFLRFIEGLDSLDEVPLSGRDGVPDLDLAAPLGYVGISMGAVHGSAFLSYAPEIKAAALAVGAQRQGEQYFQGGDFLDLFPPSLAQLIPNATPTDYWVSLTIFQMIFDHQDPHHQAQRMYRNPLEIAGTTKKASVLIVEGVGDTGVPNNCTRSLAWTMGPVPHMAPIWEASPILEQVAGPITANIDPETTAAFHQFVPSGTPGIPHTPGCEFEPDAHGCGQAAPEARLQRLLFLKSAVDNPVPTITDPLSVAR